MDGAERGVEEGNKSGEMGLTVFRTQLYLIHYVSEPTLFPSLINMDFNITLRRDDRDRLPNPTN